MPASEVEAYFPQFEKLGESAVRVACDSPAWQNELPKLAVAREWLRLKEEERALVASDKRDAREEETLAIAKSAKASVRHDRYISIAAVAIAAIAANKEIASLIGRLLNIVKP